MLHIYLVIKVIDRFIYFLYLVAYILYFVLVSIKFYIFNS